MSIYANPATRPSLDPSRYSLQEDEREFFALLTGIHDEEELKNHILAVQEKAYQVYGYPCIRRFSFIKLKIARLPGYCKALKLLEQRKDPILLDIGCCFGHDARKAVVDGWPAGNVVASDLRPEFWECGHELFKSTPTSFPTTFIAGDVFSSTTLDISDSDAQPSPNSSTIEGEGPPPPPTHPPLRDLTSLTPLKHKVSAIHASSFFHLFGEERQRALARRLACLLLPEKGSVIFGQHIARPEKGVRVELGHCPRDDDAGENATADASANANATTTPTTTHPTMFYHSPASWTKLWEEDIFGPHPANQHQQVRVRVRVDAELKEIKRWDYRDLDPALYVMDWAVEVI